MYKLNDRETHVVAGGMQPPITPNSPITAGSTTTYHTSGGTLYAVTTYPVLTQRKVEAAAVEGAMDNMMGDGSAFWNMVSDAAGDVGAASSPVTATVSVGPLQQISSGGTGPNGKPTVQPN
jgi:hypothetical protein